MVLKVKGFHTCKARGTKEELRDKVPFLSRRENQWLGQGYYFWTGSDYWAHKWGQEGNRVISKFDISMPKNQVLDLIDSVEDQLHFRKIVDCFSKGALKEAYEQRFNSEICVSSVLTWLREERALGHDVFPYGAVRAKDSHAEKRLRFLPGGRREELNLVERHQMCVYNEFKDAAVTFDCFVHPAHFMDGYDGALA
ncbi:hypothetical protein [Pseudomonas palleroniana]|uniref:hypothetical protein n=1 Tax=Pseudomonas palleroniana TaxID=191390 RepID=UPI000B177695|nr:hypothetical protein [Pseudomonas palleroniana]